MRFKLPIRSIFVAALLSALLPVYGVHAQQMPHRIEITAKRFEFTPGEITLKKGEPVVLVFKSLDVSHGVRFKDLGLETKVGKGQSSELSFTPNKTGNFVGQCAVFCGSGHGKMKLILHVVE
jgi:cytochrome c oxidase subunit 2